MLATGERPSVRKSSLTTSTGAGEHVRGPRAPDPGLNRRATPGRRCEDARSCRSSVARHLRDPLSGNTTASPHRPRAQPSSARSDRPAAGGEDLEAAQVERHVPEHRGRAFQERCEIRPPGGFHSPRATARGRRGPAQPERLDGGHDPGDPPRRRDQVGKPPGFIRPPKTSSPHERDRLGQSVLEMRPWPPAKDLSGERDPRTFRRRSPARRAVTGAPSNPVIWASI